MAFGIVREAFLTLRGDLAVFAIALLTCRLALAWWEPWSRTKAGHGAAGAAGPGSAAAAGPRGRAEAPPRSGAAAGAPAARLDEALRGRSAAGAEAALCGLLAHHGRGPPAELLACVRRALLARRLQPSPRLVELLLGGYLDLDLRAELGEALRELAPAGRAPPAVLLAAVGAAVAAGDLDAALARLRGCPALDGAPRGARRGALAGALLRLAAERGRTRELLGELSAASLLLPGTVAEMLAAADAATARLVADAARACGVALTEEAFAALLRLAGDADGARRLFAEAVRARAAGAALCALAAESAGRHADRPLAGLVLRHLPARMDVRVAGPVICLVAKGLCGGCGNSHDAVLDFYEGRCQGIDVLPHLGAARAVAEAAIQRKHLRVLDRLLAESADDEPQAALIRSLGAERRLKDVQAVFNACPRKGAFIHRAFLSACVDAADLDAAERVFEIAQQTLAADEECGATLIRALCRAGEPRRACRALDAMRAGGLEPGGALYAAVVGAAAEHGGDLRDAWRLVDEMRACGFPLGRDLCAALLRGVGRADAERALQAADELGGGADEELLATLLDALVRAGRADLVAARLRRHPEVRTARGFESVLRAWGLVKDADGARRAWARMHELQVTPERSTLACFVEALVACGGPQAGLAEVRSLPSGSRWLVTAEAYDVVLEGCVKEGNYKAVWEIHAEMREEQVPLSSGTFHTLVRSCAEGCEMWRAPGLLEEMRRQHLRPTAATHRTLLSGHCREGQAELAFEKFKDLQQIFGIRPDEQMHAVLMECCRRAQRLDIGLKLLAEMEQDGSQIGSGVLAPLVQLALSSGQLREAIRLVEEATRKHRVKLDVQLHNRLVEACAARQSLPLALRVLAHMARSSTRPDAQTYAPLLRSAVLAGRPGEAAALLRLAGGRAAAREPALPGLGAREAGALALPGGLPRGLLEEAIGGLAALQRSGGPDVAALLRDLRATRDAAPPPGDPARRSACGGASGATPCGCARAAEAPLLQRR